MPATVSDTLHFTDETKARIDHASDHVHTVVIVCEQGLKTKSLDSIKCKLISPRRAGKDARHVSQW